MPPTHATRVRVPAGARFSPLATSPLLPHHSFHPPKYDHSPPHYVHPLRRVRIEPPALSGLCVAMASQLPLVLACAIVIVVMARTIDNSERKETVHNNCNSNSNGSTDIVINAIVVIKGRGSGQRWANQFISP
ncbi:DNA polymerase theta [Echinococcus multilocularis]|uniref:DNA polymerase theta n=1 Tax=Echinococcus multilocularis TaxID=6211 RepID=A0A0S4MMN1_ECHMU|nr:DNA polymerase theta [Echinococcus multilocularis]CUT99878.1 DNA polymerase theta [Echinococcus multilocularis]